MISNDEAVRRLRSDPSHRQLVHDSYLGPDVSESARRFAASGEFAEVCALINEHISDGTLLDVGAGTGISSWAFASRGARTVYSLEPDPSDEVGRGAMGSLPKGLPIHVLGGIGEALPLRDGQIDVVYTRQVLHHTSNLPLVMRECSRVLRSGGLMLATREHVVDDEGQLRVFLETHPVHTLTGGENAFALEEYVAAISMAGFTLQCILGPWDSVINAYPAVRTHEELERVPRQRLESRFGFVGIFLDRLPGVRRMVWKRLKRPIPGRMYSFLAAKP